MLLPQRGLRLQAAQQQRASAVVRHAIVRRCVRINASPLDSEANAVSLQQGFLPVAAMAMTLLPSLPALADAAVEGAAATTEAEGGFSPSSLLVLLPLLLYGAFSLYREKLNPKATYTDFLFLCAGSAVIGNILSIVVFKVRWF